MAQSFIGKLSKLFLLYEIVSKILHIFSRRRVNASGEANKYHRIREVLHTACKVSYDISHGKT